MARMHVMEQSETQAIMSSMHEMLEKRLSVSSLAPCPVEFTASYVAMCATQSCGKCTPCRNGLRMLRHLFNDVLNNRATMETLDLIESTARTVYLSSDCAIGYEAGEVALMAIRGFRDDFEHHVQKHACGFSQHQTVPCVSGCPAGVDIPGYIALVEAGRYTEAVRLIRKDNPLPLVCVTTTAGTGSEADAGGVISCEENDEKLRLGSPKLFPRLSVVDPELMLTVPARLTAFQGFDALFHNVECFIANNHTLMGDMICREGIRNAAASLAACVSDGANLEARTQLAFANTLGGYAMVCSGCCGCHGTEHGMSAHHHDLPHGAGLIMIACAYHQHMIDAHACDDRYVEMARLMGASEGEVAEQGPSAFVTELARLKRECGVDGLAMSEWGITRDELPAIAENAITTNGALFGHDPVELSVDDVTAILEASWK